MRVERITFDAGLLLVATSVLPVYVFDSGGIQPAHAIFAAFAILTLATRGIPFPAWSMMLFALFVHSFLIEAAYVFAGSDPRFILNSVFFLYNFLLAGAVYQHVRTNGPSTLVPGIIIAAAVALVTLLITGVDLREFGDTGRATGTFNNPNQLGYFSVCLLSLSYLFYRNGSIGYWLAAGLFAVSLFLAISSLSKAAMIANSVVILIALKPASSRNSLLVWGGGTIVGIAVLLRMFETGIFDEFLFLDRLMNIAKENDSSLASRGYFAFLEGNGIQFLLGLGAQGVDDIIGHEVHSTFGSVVNNYGLLGFLLFCSAYLIWGQRIWRSYGFAGLICIVGPSTLYGITHNGIRFTIFWLLFAASMGLTHRRRAPGPQKPARTGVLPNRQANTNAGAS